MTKENFEILKGAYVYLQLEHEAPPYSIIDETISALEDAIKLVAQVHILRKTLECIASAQYKQSARIHRVSRKALAECGG